MVRHTRLSDEKIEKIREEEEDGEEGGGDLHKRPSFMKRNRKESERIGKNLRKNRKEMKERRKEIENEAELSNNKIPSNGQRWPNEAADDVSFQLIGFVYCLLFSGCHGDRCCSPAPLGPRQRRSKSGTTQIQWKYLTFNIQINQLNELINRDSALLNQLRVDRLFHRPIRRRSWVTGSRGHLATW